MLEKDLQENKLCPLIKCLVFTFHYGSRAHFIKIGENLLTFIFILISVRANRVEISGNDFHDSADILIIEARRNVRTKSVPAFIRLSLFFN